MATELGMSESQMSAYVRGHKRIGARKAREIEQKLGLPPNWMDNEASGLTNGAIELARSYQTLAPEAQEQIRALINLLKK